MATSGVFRPKKRPKSYRALARDVAAMLEVFFSCRAGRFNGNKAHFSGPIETFQCIIKPGLRRQDLKGIHLPSFRFCWKLKKVC
jgi:hypothetical protein